MCYNNGFRHALKDYAMGGNQAADSSQYLGYFSLLAKEKNFSDYISHTGFKLFLCVAVMDFYRFKAFLINAFSVISHVYM